MKQYFAVVNKHTICSQDKDAIVSWLKSWGIEGIEEAAEVPGKYQGIRIKGKGTKGESIAASSHTEFYERLKNETHIQK